MNCINKVPSSTRGMHLTPTGLVVKAESFNVERRTANYKPNVWKYDHLQSLSSKYAEGKYKRNAEKLKEDVSSVFVSANDSIDKLELIDSIQKLGLYGYFEEQIKQTLDAMSSSQRSIHSDLYATSLYFRLLRQHGFNASQDLFLHFVDETGKFRTSTNSNDKGMLELFEASNLGSEGEHILQQARLCSMKHLRGLDVTSDCKLTTKQNYDALCLPLHWRVEWFDIRKHIHVYETQYKTNSELVELAKLNFNMVQAAHQEDLKKLSRWWIYLGINEKLSFSRDRIVESFMYAGGIAFEPQYASLRKWLSKVINLILVIDDVYDIYGSLNELERFTNAVNRWSPEEINELPECMKICFWTLFNTTEEMAGEIQKEKGWKSVSPHLQRAWTDFCKSLLVEAKWYNKAYTPTLGEYLDNGWISSSGPLLSLLVILGLANGTTKDVSALLKDIAGITYCTSLIIRLCNDEGTSAAELARGDAPSSILCYMREANVSEEAARDHIRSLISRTWRKINSLCISNSTTALQEPMKYIINTARAAHFFYQKGDSFGIQDGAIQEQFLSTLIEPFALS